MMSGFLAAVALMFILLLQTTTVGTFPLPWRLLPLALIASLALTHRTSFSLGAAFYLVYAVLLFMMGMAPWGDVLLAGALMVFGYFLSTRVFASRSLPAYTGYAASVLFVSLLIRYAFLESVHGYLPFMYVFLGACSTFLAFALSLGLDVFMKGFRRSFVAKDDIYEVRAERS